MDRNTPDFRARLGFNRFIGSFRVREIRVNEIRVGKFRVNANQGRARARVRVLKPYNFFFT